MQGRLLCPILENLMDTKFTRSRQARLQTECDVSAASTILLAAACMVSALVLGLNTLTGPIAVSPARLPIEQAIPKADETEERSARRLVGSIVLQDTRLANFRGLA